MKITKLQLKQIIKEELETVLEQTYDARRPSPREIVASYYDESPLNPDKAAELEAVFAGDYEADLADDELRALELSKMYSGGREPGWFEQMGHWPAGGLEESVNEEVDPDALKKQKKREQAMIDASRATKPDHGADDTGILAAMRGAAFRYAGGGSAGLRAKRDAYKLYHQMLNQGWVPGTPVDDILKLKDGRRFREEWKRLIGR